MIRPRVIPLAALLTLVTFPTIHTIGTPLPAIAAPNTSVTCAAVTFRLQPGFNPPLRPSFFRTARDIPRRLYTVSLPRYPGSIPLSPYVAGPFPEYPADPYLQTASAEYQTTTEVATVQAWYRANLPSCGWHGPGYWTGNATAFTSGLTLVSNANPNLTLELSFGSNPSRGAYIGYGVEEITYRPRPVASYLHGPFAQVRIALQHGAIQKEQVVPYWVHNTVRDRTAIRQLVAAINALQNYHTVLPVCHGGLSLTGPAWLSFVRSNGAATHAFEEGTGPCGGVAVGGVRWLIDRGKVWKQILSLTAGRE